MKLIPHSWLWDEDRERHKPLAYVIAFFKYLPRNLLKRIPGWRQKPGKLVLNENGHAIGQEFNGRTIFFGKPYHKAYLLGRV